jgi:hypothetical protein
MCGTKPPWIRTKDEFGRMNEHARNEATDVATPVRNSLGGFALETLRVSEIGVRNEATKRLGLRIGPV